jgi:peptide/nickel transport system permease protein
MIPGDPTSRYMMSGMTQEQRERLLEQWGLTKPLHEQYIHYMVDLFTLDFGESFYFNSPIIEVLIPRITNSLVLMGPGIIIGVTLGLSLGAMYGMRRGSRFEQVGVMFSLLGRSVPIFFSGVVLQYLFAGGLFNWFPSGGMTSSTAIFESNFQMYTSEDFLRHLTLPLIVTIVWYSAVPALIMRAGMIKALNKEFQITYQSWGTKYISRMLYTVKHGAIPVITFLAVLVGYIFGGQVVLEVVFSWPGMGRLLVEAIYNQDLRLLEVTFFIMGMLIIFLNFLVDIVYMYIDPRITYEDR